MWKYFPLRGLIEDNVYRFHYFHRMKKGDHQGRPYISDGD
jgi:ABC-type microcin C transport system permease subunit YejB